MRSHIETLIAQQRDLLKNAIEQRSLSNVSLCDLQNVNFNAGGMPDYTDMAQRSLYLLRYAPAYTVEYRLAFERIFSGNYIISGRVCVLSVGCGAALDKASLHFASKASRVFRDEEMVYFGVDIADWNCDVFNPGGRFIHKGIEDVTGDEFSHYIDIIMFPKSLPEIDITFLELFVENMDGNDFQDKLYIVNSNRCSQDDNEKASQFCKLFCDAFDYEVQDEFDIGPIKKTDADKYLCIWEVFPGEHFSFPQDAIDTSNNIINLCASNTHSEKCGQCANIINRNPMLTTQYFNTRVYCLGKK